MSIGRTSALPQHLEAALGEVAARRHLLHHLGDQQIKSLVDQIGKLPNDMIARLDGEIAGAAELWSWRRTGVVSTVLGTLQPSDAELLNRFPELAYLFVFHRDGFLRERALDQMQELRSPFFITALAYRLNDWVPQVRAAAKRCADRIFPSTDAKMLADASFFLLGRRYGWGRWIDEAEALDRALCRRDVVDVLEVTLRNARAGAMGEILRYASRWQAIDIHLEGLAAEAFLPSVRGVALQELIEGIARWPVGWRRQWIDKMYGQFRLVRQYEERPISRSLSLEALVEQGARDRSGAIRKIAATALVKHRASLSNRDAIIALLERDRSPAVRNRIEWVKSAIKADQPMERPK
jgi:hypothetical protein